MKSSISPTFPGEGNGDADALVEKMEASSTNNTSSKSSSNSLYSSTPTPTTTETVLPNKETDVSTWDVSLMRLHVINPAPRSSSSRRIHGLFINRPLYTPQIGKLVQEIQKLQETITNIQEKAASEVNTHISLSLSSLECLFLFVRFRGSEYRGPKSITFSWIHDRVN